MGGSVTSLGSHLAGTRCSLVTKSPAPHWSLLGPNGPGSWGPIGPGPSSTWRVGAMHGGVCHHEHRHLGMRNDVCVGHGPAFGFIPEGTYSLFSHDVRTSQNGSQLLCPVANLWKFCRLWPSCRGWYVGCCACCVVERPASWPSVASCATRASLPALAFSWVAWGCLTP